MRIGFIGVGNIGNPMAGQLLAAGHSLVVHDLRREAAANLLAAGAVWAESPRAAAAQCEMIATCLPGPREMETVTLGPDGVLEGLAAGAVYVDHTTNSPLLVRQVDAAVRARGAAMLDAPVSGGMEGARTRDLLVMVGGERAVFERVRPVLDALAARVIYTGAIGNGSVCKITHNCASFSLDLIMAECWTAGVKAGVAPETLVDVFMNGALGHMMSLKVRLPATYLRGQFDARFALRLAHKDLGLAVELGRAYGVPMRLSTLCEQELAAAMARGWGERDASIALTLQEERAGVQVRLPG
jgi:3-hydroxyisobutyrate dehydrogenase